MMLRNFVSVFLVVLVAAAFHPLESATPPQASADAAIPPKTYLGFDRNFYPGDDALPMLRKTFSFTGYWLSPPPEEKTTTWLGKRPVLLKEGFGFAVLYLGPDQKSLKTESDAAMKGQADARAAVDAAKREGFASGTVIFLDIEEGGRLPPAYHAYLRAWADALLASGYQPGVYCSAIGVNEGHGVVITTASDIRTSESPRSIIFWVYNDACPPAPGCATNDAPRSPRSSGFPYASVWQFAQSPRRKELTPHCASVYAHDGNCYAPGDAAHKWFLDLNTANSPDPSNGAK
jgi:hypothetical protein